MDRLVDMDVDDLVALGTVDDEVDDRLDDAEHDPSREQTCGATMDQGMRRHPVVPGDTAIATLLQVTILADCHRVALEGVIGDGMSTKHPEEQTGNQNEHLSPRINDWLLQLVEIHR